MGQQVANRDCTSANGGQIRTDRRFEIEPSCVIQTQRRSRSKHLGQRRNIIDRRRFNGCACGIVGCCAIRRVVEDRIVACDEHDGAGKDALFNSVGNNRVNGWNGHSRRSSLRRSTGRALSEPRIERYQIARRIATTVGMTIRLIRSFDGAPPVVAHIDEHVARGAAPDAALQIDWNNRRRMFLDCVIANRQPWQTRRCGRVLRMLSPLEPPMSPLHTIDPCNGPFVSSARLGPSCPTNRFP